MPPVVLGFNSPLGILFVRTPAQTSRRVETEAFQFPARNSVCSDAVGGLGIGFGIQVSIPRSEFCLFGPKYIQDFQGYPVDVSIPRSEFCLFGLKLSGPTLVSRMRFNSPLGILFVRTELRDHVRRVNFDVSIPRSEFCLFGPGDELNEAIDKVLFQFPARNSVCSDPSPL